jgi:hypothetical protein
MPNLTLSKEEMTLDKAISDKSNAHSMTTISENGKVGKVLLVEHSEGFSDRNVIQIKIDNTGGTDQILYIGGLAALAGYAQLFDLPAGAQDDGTISDQYGIGCKFTQGLSLMMNKGVYIHDFQVLSTADNSLQLQQDIVVRKAYFNGDTTPITYPAAVTFEMSDNRKNMLKDPNAFFFINDLNWLEYTVIADFVGTILLQVKGADLTALISETQKR